MFITDNKIQGIKVLELNGRIEGQTDDFKIELTELVTNEDKILIDCTNLTFINSSGLRVFLTTLKEVGKKNGKFYLCNLNENVKEIFRISGFLSIFEVFEYREDAMDSF